MKEWAGYKLVLKLKRLKERIKEWTKNHFGDVCCTKANILEEIQSLDIREGLHILLDEESSNRGLLKDRYERKVKEEEIKWRQPSQCRWLKEGDKNTKFFHGMASARLRRNMINSLLDGNSRLIE